MIPLAQHGFRCIAPDMRGYGKSTVYSDKDAYTHEEIARDLLELLDHLGREKAVWIGHDHGSPAVGNLVAHYPSRVLAAAFLCVPYLPRTMELQTLEPLIDRSLYPADVYPYGQWEYQAHHYEKFEETVQYMDADPGKMVRLLFRRGSPRAIGKVAAFAKVRRDGGFFGGIALKGMKGIGYLGISGSNQLLRSIPPSPQTSPMYPSTPPSFPKKNTEPSLPASHEPDSTGRTHGTPTFPPIANGRGAR